MALKIEIRHRRETAGLRDLLSGRYGGVGWRKRHCRVWHWSGRVEGGLVSLLMRTSCKVVRRVARRVGLHGQREVSIAATCVLRIRYVAFVGYVSVRAFGEGGNSGVVAERDPEPQMGSHCELESHAPRLLTE